MDRNPVGRSEVVVGVKARCKHLPCDSNYDIAFTKWGHSQGGSGMSLKGVTRVISIPRTWVHSGAQSMFDK